jgi:hypothetical protein
MDRRLPNFFIAGVPKAGTSSAHAWLDAHPQALGSTIKETCFFADPGSHVFRTDFNIELGLERYADAFPAPAPDVRVLFESTPSYLYSRTALDRIPDLPGSPKCLFILREPAAQIQSLYTYFRNNWTYIPAEMSFAEYLVEVRRGGADFGGNELAQNALGYADYGPWLKKWRDRLGPDRVKVTTFDLLVADPRDFMMDLAVWIDLDPAFYDDFGFASENESYEPRNRGLQKLNVALRDKLPKGRLYDLARGAYRRLNTRAPVKDTAADVLADLKAEFHEKNAQLARDFDLDLSAWSD